MSRRLLSTLILTAVVLVAPTRGGAVTSWEDPPLDEIAGASELVIEARVILGGQDQAELLVERTLKGKSPPIITVAGFNSYEWNHAYYAMRPGERRILFLTRAGDIYCPPTPSSGNFPHSRGGKKVVGSISSPPLRFEIDRQVFVAAIETLLAMQAGTLMPAAAADRFAELARNSDIERRYLGVVMLGATGAANTSAGIDALVEALRTGTRPLRIAACTSLGRLGERGHSQAIPHLVRAATDRKRRNREVALAAAEAIVHLRPPRVAGALLDWVEYAGPLYAGEKRDSPVRLRYLRARRRVLGYVIETATPRLVPRLIDLIGAKDQVVARAVVIALGQLRDPRAVPALINLLEGDDWDLRSASAIALLLITLQREYNSPDAMRAWWRDHRGQKREQWVKEVIAAESRRVQAVISDDERRGAVLLLAATGDPGVIFPLASVLVHGDAPRDAPLEPAAGPLTLPFLVMKLREPGETGRVRLIATLAHVLDRWPETAPAVVPHLALRVRAVDFLERDAALEVLARLRAPSAVPGLLALLERKDTNSRRRAARALRTATGVRLSFSAGGSVPDREEAVRRWQDWWQQHRRHNEYPLMPPRALARGGAVSALDRVPSQPSSPQDLGSDRPTVWRSAFAWYVRRPAETQKFLIEAMAGRGARSARRRAVAACAAGLAAQQNPDAKSRDAITRKLVRLTRDSDPMVRAQAIWALGLAARRATPRVRAEAIAALGKRIRIRTDGRRVERELAACALATLGGAVNDPEQIKAAIIALRPAFADDNAAVRYSALAALAEWAKGKALPEMIAPLQGAIADTDEDVQLLAAALIGRLRLREALAAAWEALAASTDGRRQAVHIAERLAPAVEPGDAAALAPLLTNTNRGVRTAAARLLYLHPSKSKVATAALIEALGDDEDAVRFYAAGALGKLREPAAVERLSQLVNDWDTDVRVQAAKSLGQIGDPSGSARRAIYEHLRDALTIHAEHLIALGRLGGAPEVERIRLYVESDKWFGEYYGIKALSYLKHPRVFPILRAHWRDDESAFQGHAAESLRQLGVFAGPFLIDELRVGLDGSNADDSAGQIKRHTLDPDPNAGVRAVAARLLGECRYAGAVGALIEAVQGDPDGLVRFHAAQALGEITGLKLIHNDKVDASDAEFRAAAKRWKADMEAQRR